MVDTQEILDKLNAMFTDNVTASWNGDPHYHGFDGTYYDVYPKGWSVVAKSSSFPFEIQGDHGTYDGYEGGPTWNTKIVIQVGPTSVISLDAATSKLLSSTPLKWMPTKTVGEVAFIKDDKNSQVYIVKVNSMTYDVYIVLTTPDAKDPGFFAKIHINSHPTGKTGILGVSLTVPKIHAVNFIDALVPSLDLSRKGKTGQVVPITKNLFELATLHPVEQQKRTKREEQTALKAIMNFQTPLLNIKGEVPFQTVQNLVAGMKLDLGKEEIDGLHTDINNTPPQFKDSIFHFTAYTIAKHKDIERKEAKLSLMKENLNFRKTALERAVVVDQAKIVKIKQKEIYLEMVYNQLITQVEDILNQSQVKNKEVTKEDNVCLMIPPLTGHFTTLSLVDSDYHQLSARIISGYQELGFQVNSLPQSLQRAGSGDQLYIRLSISWQSKCVV